MLAKIEENGTNPLIKDAINYTLETINQAGISVLEHGFTHFLVYNTFQMSGKNELEYFKSAKLKKKHG